MQPEMKTKAVEKMKLDATLTQTIPQEGCSSGQNMFRNSIYVMYYWACEPCPLPCWLRLLSYLMCVVSA